MTDGKNKLNKTRHETLGAEYENFGKPKILIVDDDQGILTQLKWSLDDDYEVFCASNKNEALEIARSQKPRIVALDINLDGSNFKNKEDA